MLEGSVEVCTKSVLYWIIEGQTNFGMPRGAKVSLALNVPQKVALHSISNTTSKHAPGGYKLLDTVCKSTNGKS
jgi:hypothetical protein